MQSLFSLQLFLLLLEIILALNLCQPYACVQNLLSTFESSGAIASLSFEFVYSPTKFDFQDFPIFRDLASLMAKFLFVDAVTFL